MASSDIIVSNIKKQLALNSGELAITNRNGTYGFVNTSGVPYGAAANYILSNIPSTYQQPLRTDIYNYAKGIFSGINVPTELVESLSSLATYYVTQTGIPVTNLMRNGQLDANFMATINSFLNSSIQFGYQSLNTNPPWANNPTLHGNITAAYQLSNK